MRVLLLIVLPLIASGCLPEDLVRRAKDRDADGHLAWQVGGDDCDDSDGAIHPGASELCGDGIDNDCDGVIDDDGLGAEEFHVDADGDGYGDPDVTATACAAGDGRVANADDCDDTSAAVSPAEDEVCGDGIDNDCDGVIDDDGVGAQTFHVDADLDGFGDPDATATACELVEGLSANADDCDDTDDDIQPDADEVCGDDIDNDCDNVVDDDGVGAQTFHVDADLDGFGDPDVTDTACTLVEGLSTNDDDCDDTDPEINPDGEEICGDGDDNDCDGRTDDDGIGSPVWYPNLDGDDYTGTGSVTACAQPDKYVAVQSAEVDCNDNDASIYPGAPEIWYDGVDQDCDNADDYDQDGDGWRSAAETTDGEDCNDLLDTVNPDEEEVCSNHIDDDCDGTDNGCSPSGQMSADALRMTIIDATGASDFGSRISLGDLDADGTLEVGIGPESSDPADVRVYDDPGTGTLSFTNTTLLADYQEDLDSWADAFTIEGDYDGDGRADVVVGRMNNSTAYEGEVLVWSSPEAGSISVANADHVYVGPTYDDVGIFGFGQSVGAVGDLDADGRDELVVGQGGSDGVARCYLMQGPLPASGDMLPLADQLVVSDPESTTYACRWFTPAGDIDGDTRFEWATGSQGRVLFFERQPGLTDLANSDPEVSSGSMGFGIGPIGGHDLNDDGTPDLVVTNILSKIYVFFGPLAGANPLPISGALEVSGTDSRFVGGVSVVGDFNGDGEQDLVFKSTPFGPGAAFHVLYGPLSGGSIDLDDADLWLDPPAGGSFGAGAVGDTDGDGFDDLIVLSEDGVYIIHGAGM